jgi:hypothetical protein
LVTSAPPSYIVRELTDLLTQRITSLVLGYEDLNDADHLRHDPLLAEISRYGRS